MNAPHSHELPERLRTHADSLAAAAPTEQAADAAQRRLSETLAARTQPATARRRRNGWLAAAATACAAVALTVLPFLLSDRSGLAFAEVQRHFSDFTTLSMRIEQGEGGRFMPQVAVLLDADGNVRTDVAGELSVVVNAAQGRVLMLLHSARTAMSFPIDAGPAMPAQEALRWIDELRTFKGIATPLAEPAQINGETAYGWTLKIAGAELTLWAREDGQPLAMQVGEGLGLDLRFRFDFDAPIDPALFSTDVPAGYNG